MLISDIPSKGRSTPYNVPLLPIRLKCFDLCRVHGPAPHRHWHENAQLVRVLKGSACLHVESTEIRIREGDFLMIASRKGHIVLNDGSNPCIVQSIMADLADLLGNHFLPNQIYEAILLEINRNHLLVRSNDPASGSIHEIMDQIFRIEDSHPASASLQVLGLFYRLLGILLNCHEEKTHHDSALSPGKAQTTEEDSINKMLSYIAKFYMKNIRLENIAHAGNVCRSRCCTLFKSYLGLSPVRFLNTYRLSIGKDLLLTTDRKITDIAAQCGLRNESYFIKLFAEKYGSTPRVFRSVHRV